LIKVRALGWSSEQTVEYAFGDIQIAVISAIPEIHHQLGLCVLVAYGFEVFRCHIDHLYQTSSPVPVAYESATKDAYTTIDRGKKRLYALFSSLCEWPRRFGR